MKVLYFTQTYTTHDRRFLEKLGQTDHRVWFLPLENAHIQREQRPVPDGIQIASWPDSERAQTRPLTHEQQQANLAEIIHNIQPDLIHAGPVQSCGYLAALTQFHPLLLMSWGSDLLVDADRNKQWRQITKFTLKASDLIVCDCQAVEEKVNHILHTPPPIIKFPWGVNLDQFKPSSSKLNLRHQLNWQDNPIVLSTRSWEPIYGIDVLLDAFRQTLIQVPKARLILAGSGSLTPQIQTFIQDHDLQKQIYSPGQIAHDELAEYFNLADLYVSSSHSDGSSISLLEALACALPVVVSDIPGNREWVQNGQNGWLFKSGNASSLTNTLKTALQSQSLWPTLGQHSLTIVRQRADWNQNFHKLLVGYENLFAAS